MSRLTTLPITLLLATTVAASDPPPLKNNPFSRPPAPVFVDDARPATEPGNAPLRVIATMVSAREALANVDGDVLRPGQEIRGYLLKHIFEDRAIFEKNGNEVTIFVKPKPEGNDDKAIPRTRRR